MTINLNDLVTVRLNDVGQKQLVRCWEPSYHDDQAAKEKACDTCYPGWRDGLVKFHLWELMEIFGPISGLGGQILFVDNCIYLEGDT